MYYFTSTDEQDPGDDVCRSLQNYGFSVWIFLRITVMAPTLLFTYYQNFQMKESEMLAGCSSRRTKHQIFCICNAVSVFSVL